MDNKVLFGILNILFNCYGVPAFMVGNTKAGILQLVLCFVTCGIVGTINGIMGIIAGIKMLTMTDEEYAAADKVALLMGIPSAAKKTETDAQ